MRRFSGDWETFFIHPWRWSVLLMDGTKAYWSRTVMRRKLPDGSWQYRRMTDQEAADEQDKNAW